jgi:hypothetical protein
LYVARSVNFPSSRCIRQIKATIANQKLRAAIQEFLQPVCSDEWIHAGRLTGYV